ncbi:hypothetical protein D6855_02555 [Butyrivibrio sp. CB08]|uniref:hypothetical protein n=1 Tax=Butyrivibrio sp. CB08 TaxID=2364879 RepID=UPI000EAA32ED|nr:hypothetical protein [Butyrivibrio sp. CB08]RKM62318.1 hypothetical protein D6855_02555 [Butyrivibrio sp. CB08]
MSVEAYLNPDFTIFKKLIFLLVTLALIGIGLGFIYLVSMMVLDKDIPLRDRKWALMGAFEDKSQRLFEMIIAGTSVMSFSCAYVIINHVYTLVQTGVAGSLTPFEENLVRLWTDSKDFVLLFLICMSCVINTILDSLIIPLKKLSKQEKATMRMLAMFYVIILLMYLNYIGDESQYSPVMMYYFGLMVGRFVYFDASFKDFLGALKNMFFNLPYMALNLILTGLLCWFGFSAGYFLERNYFIMGIFYTHLFLLICIFLIHIVWMIARCASDRKRDNY